MECTFAQIINVLSKFGEEGSRVCAFGYPFEVLSLSVFLSTSDASPNITAGFVQAMEFWKNYGILKRKFHIWKNYGIEQNGSTYGKTMEFSFWWKKVLAFF